MSEPVQRRHVLEPFLAGVETQAPAECGVAMEVLPYRGYLNLRGDPNDRDFVEAVREALGQSLPVAANTFSQGTCRVFWLGPDEWLVMTEPGEEEALSIRLAEALSGRTCALTDLTGGQICIRLSGGNARDVLAKGSTLDLHPRVFRQGQCAQTALGKASMLICRSGAAPGAAGDDDFFDIVVRRTFAEYAAKWLYRCAEEFGARVDCEG